MLKDLVLKNRSYRRFDQSKSISKEILLGFVDLARNAPSGRNLQTAQHALDRVYGLVQIRERRVLAAEHRKITRSLSVGCVAFGEMASERLPEIGSPVVGRAACVCKIDLEQLG